MVTEMVLRGFLGRLGDLQGRMRFCHPILSAKSGGTDLFVAKDIRWSSDGKGLEPVNEEEVRSFGTLWPESTSTIGPGVGVAVIGKKLMREVSASVGSAEAEGLPFEWDDRLGCWIAVCRRTEFDACAKRLAELSREVFDRELRRCASKADKLSRIGTAALFVLRRAPGRRDTDVAMRDLVAASVQSEHDLYRRLLRVLSVKLRLAEDALDRQARRHVESIRSAVFVEGLDPQNARLVRKVKSTKLVSEPAVRGNDERSSDDAWKALVTYVSELFVNEKGVVSSKEKVVRNTIVHYRPLDFADDHCARIEQIESGIGEWDLWKKMETNPTRQEACRQWMTKQRAVKKVDWS